MQRIIRSFLFMITMLTTASAYEHVILSGGPALTRFENYRVPNDRHDRWWANFIRAATLHMDILRSQYGETETITWYVYKNGYDLRGREDGKPYTSWIAEQAAKRGAKLVWISSGSQFISNMNALPAGRTKTLHYFGHSNKHCFLLDYSSQILGASAAWLHENELSSLSRRPFSKNAICKSWGCYTGESMSKYWRQATGLKLIGAKGKTDYEALSFGRMPDINGRWTY
ncbi:hypothetical protein ACFPK9_13730 [Rubritalea spongiae]|uniref:Peptidase C39-like domain-containing protein n=1 Tax=Rubritalea spongiae TaxID=430797 RepID=A0ABW5E0G2_9BACT